MGRLSRKVSLMESIDVDTIPIQRDIFLPNAYVIELPLDSQPDYIWQTVFEHEWRSSLHLWERKVAIVGDKLMLVTTPTEIGEKIDWLRKIIESTNLRVEKLYRNQEIVRDAEKVEELRKHENIIRDEIRTKLALA